MTTYHVKFADGHSETVLADTHPAAYIAAAPLERAHGRAVYAVTADYLTARNLDRALTRLARERGVG